MTREQRILSLAAIVHGAARRYPGDKDDLTQAAWVGAIHAVDTWDEQTSSLHGYAWQCCNWAIGKHLRKTNGVRADRKAAPLTFVSFDQAIPNESCDNAAVVAVGEDGIESAPARIDLRRMLGRLEPRDRAIVVLLAEYSQHEIARMIGCSAGTIGRVLQRLGNPPARPYRADEVHRRIVELRASGVTFRQIAKALNDDDVPTSSGVGRWHHGAVRRIYNDHRQQEQVAA